jgi:hypothetical protein
MMTLIGLALDIIGVVLLFFYEPPKVEHSWALNSAPSEEEQEREYKIKRVVSKIALLLICLGFVCQIIGTLSNR